jgi:hypothetical protein
MHFLATSILGQKKKRRDMLKKNIQIIEAISLFTLDE